MSEPPEEALITHDEICACLVVVPAEFIGVGGSVPILRREGFDPTNRAIQCEQPIGMGPFTNEATQ